MSCDVCGATSAGGQFCIACGRPLTPALTPATATVGTRERPRQARSNWLSFQEIRLLACPRCGAPNSAARWHCARCGAAFDERAQQHASAEAATPTTEAPPVQPESARWLALITIVAGVAVVAVAVVMLASRGVGPFGADSDGASVTQAARAGVADVSASSPAGGPSALRALTDGDPATAWHIGGDASGQWIELRLKESVQIDHLLIWNGDQGSGDSFAHSNPVKDVLISFPDVGKGYTATFPNRTANFRVDMIDPPVSNRIRIQIRDVYGGEQPLTALSEVEALVNSTGAAE